MTTTLNTRFFLRYALQIILSVVFLLSAWLKLYPIEPFELTLVDSGIVPWSLAPYVARILIGVEGFIGIALLLNTKNTLPILKSALYLTLFFSVYLLLLWWFRGNDVNCGCFGVEYSMTPIESLLKNAVLIIVILSAIKLFNYPTRNYKWAYAVGLIALIATPFILNPTDGYFASYDETQYPYKLQTELIPDTILSKVPVNLNQGEYILAFLSVTCPHCKVGAQKLSVASKKLDLPQTHAFFIGDEDKMEEFKYKSNSDLPYTMYRENSFFKFNKGQLPTFLLVKDGMVLKRWAGSDFSYEEIAKIDAYLNANK